MKTIKQLLRQPLKTGVGLVLMTLAAAILCLCVGQALAAQHTKEALDERFSTIGIPLVHEDMRGVITEDSYKMEDELLNWIAQMSREHPDIVQGVARQGALTAYIPEMMPYNPLLTRQSQYVQYYPFQSSVFVPYSCTMLVVTIDTIGKPREIMQEYVRDPYLLTEEDFPNKTAYYIYLQSVETMYQQAGYRVTLIATVDQALGLEEGYLDPVGRTATLTLNIPTLEALEELNLVTGEQYIIYGMDYVDEHGQLIYSAENDKNFVREQWTTFDPELLHVYTEEDIADSYGIYAAVYAGVKLKWGQYEQLNKITMTLENPAGMIHFDEIRDEEGYLQDLVEKSQYSVTDEKGNTLVLTKEEYVKRYGLPVIERLEGNATDFLNSRQGQNWKEVWEWIKFTNHGFQVFGVDKMDYFAAFALKRAQIVQGRDFTQEELLRGDRVCLIQEALAEVNGLQIGDTITLQFYPSQNSLPNQYIGAGKTSAQDPTGFHRFDPTTLSEGVVYTIIGFYRNDNWPDLEADPYAFSANTVFVPKASEKSMEETDSIVLNTLLLQNGKIEDFHALAKSAGFAGRFKYYDQDYSTIAVNFHNYEALAQEMLVIGAVLYMVLLLLFLLLYPGFQKKNAATMQSLGCGFLRRLWHVLLSSLGIVVPASLLGGWIGRQLWGKLVAALQTTAESSIALQIESGALVKVALAQLLFAVVMTISVAAFVTAPRKMASRR